jgi:hypothetical protein
LFPCRGTNWISDLAFSFEIELKKYLPMDLFDQDDTYKYVWSLSTGSSRKNCSYSVL